MKIEVGLHPNCSEYTLRIDMPVEKERKNKLVDMIESFSSSNIDGSEEQERAMIEAEEGIEGIYITSFHNVDYKDHYISIRGYLNEGGLCKWLEKHGYQFEIEGD